jgi:hypothetical protein
MVSTSNDHNPPQRRRRTIGPRSDGPAPLQTLPLVHNSCRSCEKSETLEDSRAGFGAVESVMAHISGFDRSQVLLLPEAVEDYVGSDNPVRFIDAFVDGLDLAAAGFARVAPAATGRPGYAPGDLLKLYIYGYLNRVWKPKAIATSS